MKIITQEYIEEANKDFKELNERCQSMIYWLQTQGYDDDHSFYWPDIRKKYKLNIVYSDLYKLANIGFIKINKNNNMLFRMTKYSRLLKSINKKNATILEKLKKNILENL